MQANGQFSISVNPDSLHQDNIMAFVPGDFPLTRPVDGLSRVRSYPLGIIRIALGGMIAEYNSSGTLTRGEACLLW
jgi:hypothetical protein